MVAGNMFLLILLAFLSAFTSCLPLESAEHEPNPEIVALKAFKSAVTDPFGVLSDWVDSIHHCNWTGVSCDSAGGNVVSITLFQKELRGAISPFLGNFSSLQTLDLSWNLFTGSLPAQLGLCSELAQLLLAGNSLSGAIPSELGKLKNLKILDLWSSFLKGTIPESISNCSALSELHLGGNSLSGAIPSELGKLKNLQILELRENYLNGTIPESVSNCSALSTINFNSNDLTGTIPQHVGNLINHETFVASSNDVFGSIPNSIGRLHRLTKLDLSQNQLSGTIPSEIGNLYQLLSLELRQNDFTGAIPVEISKLAQLRSLGLEENNLEGVIPDFFLALKQLREVTLVGNRLTGPIPSSISRLPYLSVLDLSRNELNGSIPSSMGDLSGLAFLGLSSNRLTGRLPVTLESCRSLVSLNLSQNNLSGGLSVNFAKLDHLASLDLSCNEFNGSIPRSLADVSSLNHLNLSHNRLEGPVPNSGYFLKTSSSSFEGNPRLCGLQFLSPCHNSNKFSKQALLIVLIVSSVSLLLLLIIASVVVSRCIRKRKTEDTEEKITGYPDLKRFTSREIERATDSFDEGNVIGRSAISIIYRGTLPDGRVVAVKKLSLNQFSAVSDRCFNTELNILTRLRHRNLVKIEGYAWESGKLKALVLEFMKNGSLETIIHDPSRDGTRWVLAERLKLLISAANGLVYLHSEYDFPILHCDLKPSNILLDENFEAHVSDFGTARILGIHLQDGSSLSSSPSVFQGTIGYLAPELAYMGRSSTKADVFSFGVVIMELLTKKRPTSGLEDNGVPITLREYVQKALATGNGNDALLKLVDPHLAQSVRNDIERENILKLLKLAISCTAHYPNDRPDIEDVLSYLLNIKC